MLPLLQESGNYDFALFNYSAPWLKWHKRTDLRQTPSRDLFAGSTSAAYTGIPRIFQQTFRSKMAKYVRFNPVLNSYTII